MSEDFKDRDDRALLIETLLDVRELRTHSGEVDKSLERLESGLERQETLFTNHLAHHQKYLWAMLIVLVSTVLAAVSAIFLENYF